MLLQLLNAVKDGKLGVLDRYGLVSDLYALVKAGKTPAAQFLALMSALVNEDEYLIWQCVDSGVRSLVNVLDRNAPELKEQMDKFICTALEPVAQRLGWEVQEGEDPHRSQLRALILGSLSKSGHQPTIEKALNAFENYQKTGSIHPDLRGMVFGTVARNQEKGSEVLLKIFEENDSSEVQRNALMASIQTKDREARENVLNYAVSHLKIKLKTLSFLIENLN